jgi:hypothetical protein
VKATSRQQVYYRDGGDRKEVSIKHNIAKNVNQWCKSKNFEVAILSVIEQRLGVKAKRPAVTKKSIPARIKFAMHWFMQHKDAFLEV